MRFIMAFGVVLALIVGAQAREYAPRIVSNHRADAYSMRTFSEFPRWRQLHGDALAWEVYKYLVDTHTGLFHVNEVLEGNDVLSEYRVVRDPVKIINVYGYGFCALLGPVMAGVWEDMGQGPARTVNLPDWSHVVSEVFYDGKWHYVDLDVRAVFRRTDGTLASLDEARGDPSLWRGRGPLFFPEDSLEQTRRIYQRTRLEHYHGFNQGGHTMDFVLRQGETLTRWWTPQGGRWHHPRDWNKHEWLRRLIEQEPRGPKPNHRNFTIHNYANGRFHYQPNLTNRSTDFDDGVYEAKNLQPDGEGLTLKEPGEGFAVFEVRSPYVIVPRVGDLETTNDDCEASVVKADGQSVSLALSVDNGLTWQELKGASWPANMDLTRLVSGRYGFLLKVQLRGQPGLARLRSLAITTWVQVAPASLPILEKGKNRLEYRTGDHYGLKTRVREIRSNASNPRELLPYLVEPPANYDPRRPTGRIQGPVTVKVEAMPETRIAWFSAEGSFATHQGEAARRTRNSISYAVDQPRNFLSLYQAAVPPDTAHWHCNARREVKLEKPVHRLFVRYVGDPALNNFNIYAHCLDDGRPSTRPVTITHTWREQGQEKSYQAALRQPAFYEVVTEGEPENQSIEMRVPSDSGR